MGRLTPGERALLAAEQKKRERERVRQSWEASQARVDRYWNGLPPEQIGSETKSPKRKNRAMPDDDIRNSTADDADHADKNKTKKIKILIIEPGDLPKVAERVRDLLAASGHFFDRGLPVRIAERAGSRLPVASPLTTHGVVRAAHQLCRPIKDGESATLPDRVAAIYLDMVGDWQLPPLLVISTAPILSDDGDIRGAA